MNDTSEFFSMPGTAYPEGERLFPVDGERHGFCELFKIERSGRFRALKCLKEEFRGEALYESLLRKEFEIGFSLSHNNICQYYDLREVAGLGHCIEMEWIDGRTLEEALEARTLGKEDSQRILEQLCDALSYMHSKQVFHRDLKPSNILLTYSGNTVKLIDFGLSDSDSHSILKEPAGTAAFTAPEVLAGGKADARSDIFSLGMVMYTLPCRFRRVARKCCEKRPGFRYQNAAEVEKALQSNGPLVQGILFILLVAVVATLTLLPQKKDADASGPDTAVQEQTTDVPGQANVSSEASSAVPGQSTAAPGGNPTAPDSAQAADSPAQIAPKPSGKAAGKKGAAKPSKSDAEAIDEIFRQATDIFDN